jgi:hypothetical protein
MIIQLPAAANGTTTTFVIQSPLNNKFSLSSIQANTSTPLVNLITGVSTPGLINIKLNRTNLVNINPSRLFVFPTTSINNLI